MRLRRSMNHRRVVVAGESSSSSNIPPQSAVRGRSRGSSSSSSQPRLTEAPRSRPRMVTSSALDVGMTEAEHERLDETFQELGRRFFRETFPDVDAALDFSERRRRAVRYNLPGSSGSQIPTLRTAAAAVRARAIISGRRNSTRRNQGTADNEDEQVIRMRARTDPSTFRTVFDILPGPGEPTLEEAARERARLEREHRREARNRVMDSSSQPPPRVPRASRTTTGCRVRLPAVPIIDLTTNEDRPVSPISPVARILSSDSSSTSSSSSESGSQLASPLSAITSEEESSSFLGAIGNRTSSNEEWSSIPQHSLPNRMKTSLIVKRSYFW